MLLSLVNIKLTSTSKPIAKCSFISRIFVTEIVCPLIQVANGNPPSGTCTKNDLSYQTKCTLSCASGYILQGTPVRQCQQDKTWSGSDVTCERKLGKHLAKHVSILTVGGPTSYQNPNS